MKKRITAMYFSPTGTTKEVVSALAKNILVNVDGEISVNIIDFTYPEVRKKPVSFNEEDVVLIGVPVYAGRVPNVLLKYLSTITGNGAWAVAVVLYGNRNYDDALIELKDILEFQGFKLIAGGAFIGEHSFSNRLAQNRPDEKDMALVHDFADHIYTKITTCDQVDTIVVTGNEPYRNYYMPKDKNGNPVDLRKVTPKTNSNCVDCRTCVNLCPMGSIDAQDVSQLKGICIKCGACIKRCPAQAKYFDDQDYLRHKHELESEYSGRKEPELFV